MAAEEVKFTFSMDDQFSKKAKEAESKITSLESKMSGLGKMVAGAFSVAAVVSFGKAVVDSLVNYQYFHASLKTLLGGNLNMAAALETQLIALAKTTPFSLVDVQQGTKQLLAYGFQAGSIIENMKMLGDISSGVGKPLTDVVYLYGTLRTQGRAFTKDINQFTTAGINLLPQLAKQFKITEGEVMKFVEAGKVGFKDVETAFKSMTSEGGQFFGMMDEQNKTVGGQISALGDSWEQLKVHIGQSQTGILASTVSWSNNMIAALSDYFDKSNKLDANIKSSGAKAFTTADKINHELLGIVTGYHLGNPVIQEQENFQYQMGLYTKPKNLAEAYKSKQQLYYHSIGKDEELKKGLIDQTQAERYQATIKGAMAIVQGSIDMFKSGVKKSDPNKPSNDPPAGTKKEAEKLRTPNYNQITINIDQMTGVENLSTTDNKMIPIDIGDEILKLMTKGVTDAQIVAGARI
jgi:hypothetical protein